MEKSDTVIRKIIEECLLLSILTAFILLPGTISHATVFWDDELEGGNNGYSLPTNGGMTFDTSVKYSGTASLRYNFPSSCYPDANAQVNCGGITDRYFTATTNLYKRFYFRLSPGFVVSDVCTKMMRSDSVNLSLHSNWWSVGCWGSKNFMVGVQGYPSGNTTNKYSSFTFKEGIWYCVETHEQFNTPGVANGIIEAWVDGVQVMSMPNIMWLQSGQTNAWNRNVLYRQTGEGSLWFDRLAVGDQRIGCGGSASPTSGTVPSPPTQLTVQ